jgi:hypothetical protein
MLINNHFKRIIIFTAIVLTSSLPLPNIKNDITKANLIEKIHKIDQRERDEIVNKLKVHNLSDIEPQNHIDAVAIESDGSFNKGIIFNYKSNIHLKECFFVRYA